jgi:hypothetical protein
VKPRYPVYVISKGRHDCCHTAKFLKAEGVEFRLVVEPQEAELYAAAGYGDHLLLLPESALEEKRRLKLASVPARNFVWEHAKAAGAARHWILDDNILGMWRCWRARKIRCDAGAALRVIEDFADRYENVAVAGANYYMFAANLSKQPPFVTNCHVYSCMLIRCDLPNRWRGRNNEDVDLCLQVLADGWCTVLVNAFLCWKMQTQTVKGGNTAELYHGDSRLKGSRLLERTRPGIVETRRRFQRPHFVVKNAWRSFDTKLVRRKDIDWDAIGKGPNEYGLDLVQVGEIKNETIRSIVKDRIKGKRAANG